MAIADVIEPSRALPPRQSGWASVDGVRVAYEVFGEGEETILLLPPWAIVHSRFWKAQVPYLARHFRVVTFDARGNGRSDRPQTVDAYGPRKTVEDAIAVMDEVGVADCVAVVHCGTAPAGLALVHRARRTRPRSDLPLPGAPSHPARSRAHRPLVRR